MVFECNFALVCDLGKCVQAPQCNPELVWYVFGEGAGSEGESTYLQGNTAVTDSAVLVWSYAEGKPPLLEKRDPVSGALLDQIAVSQYPVQWLPSVHVEGTYVVTVTDEARVCAYATDACPRRGLV